MSLFDDSDSWLAGIGVDVQGIIGSVQQTASAVMEDVKSAGAAAWEQAQGAVSTAAAAVTGGAPAAKPAAKPSAPTGKPSTVSTLKGSVGQGGTNNPEDVKAVQAALNIAVDGQCGGGTIGAIKAFQKSIGQANPDGRIDPGGATARALAGRGGDQAPAPAPNGAPNGAPDDAASDEDSGSIFDRLKGLGKKVVKGVEDFVDDAKDFVPSLPDLSDANPDLANNAGIKIPKLSLDHLTKDQIEIANRFLAAHVTSEFDPFSPLDAPTLLVKLKGKRASVDQIVEALKAEIPPRVLQNPTAELKDLVERHLNVTALKIAEERRKLRPQTRLADGSLDPNVTHDVAIAALTEFLERVLKAQGGSAVRVTAPVRLAGRTIAKGTGPGPTFLEGNGPFPGRPADLARAIVRVLPPKIPRENVEALDRIPATEATSTQPANIAAALTELVKKEVQALVSFLPKSVQDSVVKAIPDLISAGVTALVEHGMEDSALKGKLDDNAKKVIKAIVEAATKQNPDGPAMDRKQDTDGSPNAPNQPQPREPSQPEQPKIKDEKIIKTPSIKTPDGPPPKPVKP
jgi:hypothetical protein